MEQGQQQPYPPDVSPAQGPTYQAGPRPPPKKSKAKWVLVIVPVVIVGILYASGFFHPLQLRYACIPGTFVLGKGATYVFSIYNPYWQGRFAKVNFLFDGNVVKTKSYWVGAGEDAGPFHEVYVTVGFDISRHTCSMHLAVL